MTNLFHKLNKSSDQWHGSLCLTWTTVLVKGKVPQTGLIQERIFYSQNLINYIIMYVPIKGNFSHAVWKSPFDSVQFCMYVITPLLYHTAEGVGKFLTMERCLRYFLTLIKMVPLRCVIDWNIPCFPTIMFDLRVRSIPLTHWGLVTPYGDEDLGQHWFMLPDGTKPLPEPMLADYQ